MKRLLTLALLTAATATTAVTYEVTAYCGCAKCCGRAGQPTASGVMPRAGVTVAAPRAIPFGTKLQVPGVGTRTVQDRLAKRYDHRIDVFMPTHAQAKAFGVKRLEVR